MPAESREQLVSPSLDSAALDAIERQRIDMHEHPARDAHLIRQTEEETTLRGAYIQGAMYVSNSTIYTPGMLS